MLGKFLKINNNRMPNPVSGTFSFTYNPDENVFANEAGEQMSNIKRLNRLSWAGQFNCTSAMRDSLTTICRSPSCSCEVDGVTYNGRLRLNGEVSMVAGSELTEGTQGLWTLSLKFEEF